MSVRNPQKIGDPVCDMHYGGRVKGHKELNELYIVRSIIEFPLSDADSRDAVVVSQARNLEGWLSKLSKDAGHSNYLNKYLIVVGEKTPDGFLPCAYLYDGRRFGMCEIKAHADHLHEALTS